MSGRFLDPEAAVVAQLKVEKIPPVYLRCTPVLASA